MNEMKSETNLCQNLQAHDDDDDFDDVALCMQISKFNFELTVGERVEMHQTIDGWQIFIQWTSECNYFEWILSHEDSTTIKHDPHSSERSVNYCRLIQSPKN